MKVYIFTITYNFDYDYIAKKFDSYNEAIKVMQEYLEEEIKTVKQECEYTPSVLHWMNDDITLVYAEGYTTDNVNLNYLKENCASYKIFEVEI